ncbi:small ribosomal subunit protein bS1m-like [Daphnia carinata]|uniref:small ribosomal subunit protein bS1m-like n=1 Tax=Daphnia carinata TaxID=120202 RepID=UPI00257D6C8E|nr:small ribosomal subunit protein bS1m-like [Daphnia carinata]
MEIILRQTTFFAGSSLIFRSFRPISDIFRRQASHQISRNYSDANIESNSKNENSIKSGVENKTMSGFGKAFEKFSLLTRKTPQNEPDVKFATLLRHSKLMQLGDPQGKVVEGKIARVVGNDLYIDFGWKFECVCPKPLKNERDYVRGSKVRLRLQSLELSTKFLGATKEITLREADAVLVGVVRTPFQT